MRTAGIAFRREGILDFLEGKVLGVWAACELLGRRHGDWLDLEAKYSRQCFDKESQVTKT